MNYKNKNSIIEFDKLVKTGEVLSFEFIFSSVVFDMGDYSHKAIEKIQTSFITWVSHIEEKMIHDLEIEILGVSIVISKNKFLIKGSSKTKETKNLNKFEKALFNFLLKGKKILFLNYFILSASQIGTQKNGALKIQILNSKDSAKEIEKIEKLNVYSKNEINDKSDKKDVVETAIVSLSKFEKHNNNKLKKSKKSKK